MVPNMLLAMSKISGTGLSNCTEKTIPIEWDHVEN